MIAAFLMVPIWGFMGAVYAILLNSLFSIILHYLYLIKYNLKIDLINLIKPSLLTIIVLLFYYQFIPDSLIFKNVLLIAYLLTIYLLLPEIKEIFRQIVRHLFRIKSGNSGEKVT